MKGSAMTISTDHSATPVRTEQQHVPQTVALEVLARLEAAWNDADGAAFGSDDSARAPPS